MGVARTAHAPPPPTPQQMSNATLCPRTFSCTTSSSGLPLMGPVLELTTDVGVGLLVFRDRNGSVCGGEAAYEVRMGHEGDKMRTESLGAAVRFLYGTAIEAAISCRAQETITFGIEIYDTAIHGAFEETIDAITKSMPPQLFDRLVDAVQTHSVNMMLTRSKRKRPNEPPTLEVKTEAGAPTTAIGSNPATGGSEQDSSGPCAESATLGGHGE